MNNISNIRLRQQILHSMSCCVFGLELFFVNLITLFIKQSIQSFFPGDNENTQGVAHHPFTGSLTQVERERS